MYNFSGLGVRVVWKLFILCILHPLPWCVRAIADPTTPDRAVCPDAPFQGDGTTMQDETG